MTEGEFESLAIKVLAGAATPDEEKHLHLLTAQNADRAGAVAEMKAILTFAKATFPTTEALKKQEPKLPEYRLNELQEVVRHRFPQKNKSLQPWWRVWFPQLATGSIAIIVLLSAVSVGMMPASGPVEFGAYADPLTRGGEETLSPDAIPGLQSHHFTNEADFISWQNKHTNACHARIWLDEEHDLLHIVHERQWDIFSTEQTLPLPAETEKRQALLKRVVEEIQGNSK